MIREIFLLHNRRRELENMQFCRNDSRQLVYSMVDNSGANRPMFSQLDQHGAFTPCCTRSAWPFPSASRVAVPVHGLVASTTSAFFYSASPSSPARLPLFAKVFLEVRTACEPSTKVKTVPASFDRAMKISLCLTFGLSTL